MTEMLYLYDHYLREFNATVVEFPDNKSVVLDRTLIYPRGGGQPSDKGTLTFESGRKVIVSESSKDHERVTHVLAEVLTPDAAVEIEGNTSQGCGRLGT